LLQKAIQENSTDESGFQFILRPFSYGAVCKEAVRGKRPIVHIHWETNIYGSKNPIVSIVRMGIRFPILFFARACGARIVWTLHNLHSHDYPFPRLDAFGRACMWHLANAVIVQNKKAAESLQNRHPHVPISYIPHGNYVAVYGPRISKVQAREKLGIPSDKFVILALGTIRPYKQLELLIDAIQKAAIRDPNAFLLIAGKGEAAYVAELQKRVAHPTAVRIISNFIPDAEVPLYLGAADYSAFAYGDSSLTSGASILALSYGVPVITLATPAAELIQEGVNGFVAQNMQELSALLENHPAQIPPSDVQKTVLEYSWERVGKETRALYARLSTSAPY
jgi:glycosyltransferase involved in cell wall biosynthesis